MADIRFRCPYCRKSLRLAEEHAGRKVGCPVCKGRVTVPRSTPVAVSSISSENQDDPFAIKETLDDPFASPGAAPASQQQKPVKIAPSELENTEEENFLLAPSAVSSAGNFNTHSSGSRSDDDSPLTTNDDASQDLMPSEDGPQSNELPIESILTAASADTGQAPTRATQAGHCPICDADQTQQKTKTLYGHQVCGRCHYRFVRFRQLAFVLDYAVLVVLYAVIFAYLLYCAFNQIKSPPGLTLMVLLVYLAFICKDGSNGQSLGKKILGLQVMDESTCKPASYLASAKRNILMMVPVVFWILGLMLQKGKRPGDEWAHTKVIWKKHAQSPVFSLEKWTPPPPCKPSEITLNGMNFGKDVFYSKSWLSWLIASALVLPGSAFFLGGLHEFNSPGSRVPDEVKLTILVGGILMLQAVGVAVYNILAARKPAIRLFREGIECHPVPVVLEDDLVIPWFLFGLRQWERMFRVFWRTLTLEVFASKRIHITWSDFRSADVRAIIFHNQLVLRGNAINVSTKRQRQSVTFNQYQLKIHPDIIADSINKIARNGQARKQLPSWGKA